MGGSIGTDRARALALAVVAGLALVACQPAGDPDGGDETADGRDAAGSLTSEEAIQLERGVWELLAEGDYAGFGDRLADDIKLVGAEGVIGKQALLDQLEGSEVEAYELGEFQVMQPGSGVAAVVYRYSETFRPPGADSAISFGGWATSVWENRGGTWRAVLHHATEAPSETEE